MISLATAMSKPVTRVMPFSSGPWPMVIWRSMRSLVSITRRQVMLSGSISRRAKRLRSSGVSVFGSVFVDAELLQPAQHDRRKTPAAVLRGGTEAIEQRLILLLRFVEHARVDRRGQQIVGGGDGVDVARQVEVELLHRNDLAVAAARRAALDPERGTLAGLANAGEHFLAEMRAERLAQTDRRGRLALAERRGRDRGDHDVLAVGAVLQAVANRKMYLGLALAVELKLVGKNARFRGDLLD